MHLAVEGVVDVGAAAAALVRNHSFCAAVIKEVLRGMKS